MSKFKDYLYKTYENKNLPTNLLNRKLKFIER